MKKLISAISVAVVVKLATRYAKRVRKVRLAYLVALPVIVGGLILIFEWDFVQHLVTAMVLEGVLHKVGEAAIEVEESA